MKRRINVEEIVDDIIYFSIAASISLFVTFLFDIHHSFYQESIFPLKFIFKSKEIYFVTTFSGGILGLLWIKLFIFALQENTFEKIKRKFSKLKSIIFLINFLINL
jgi:hypothetical protein